MDQQDLKKLKYILYIVPDDLNCIRAQRLVPRQARIRVQNVRLLPSKPLFLDGVPFLIRLADDRMFKGTDALQELKRYWTFLDSVFVLDAEPDTTLKVGYVSSAPGTSIGVAFPLTAPDAPPPAQQQQQQPVAPPATFSPQQPMVQPQQQQVPTLPPMATVAPQMLPLPPPNMGFDGVVQAPQAAQLTSQQNVPVQGGVAGLSLNTAPAGLPPPLPSRIKPAANAILPLPPPQDPSALAAPLNFNPLHVNSNAGYSPEALTAPTQQPVQTQPPLALPLQQQPQFQPTQMPVQPQFQQPPPMAQPQFQQPPPMAVQPQPQFQQPPPMVVQPQPQFQQPSTQPAQTMVQSAPQPKARPSRSSTSRQPATQAATIGNIVIQGIPTGEESSTEESS